MGVTMETQDLEKTVMGVQKLANLMLLGVPVFFGLGWVAVWTDAIPEAVVWIFAATLLLGVIVSLAGSLALHAHARRLVRQRSVPRSARLRKQDAQARAEVAADAASAAAGANDDHAPRSGGLSLLDMMLFVGLMSVSMVGVVVIYNGVQQEVERARVQEEQSVIPLQP